MKFCIKFNKFPRYLPTVIKDSRVCRLFGNRVIFGLVHLGIFYRVYLVCRCLFDKIRKKYLHMYVVLKKISICALRAISSTTDSVRFQVL